MTQPKCPPLTNEALTEALPAVWSIADDPTEGEPIARGEVLDGALLLHLESGRWRATLAHCTSRKTTEPHDNWRDAVAELADFVAAWWKSIGADELIHLLDLSEATKLVDPQQRFDFVYGPWMNALCVASSLPDDQQAHLIKMAPKLAAPEPPRRAKGMGLVAVDLEDIRKCARDARLPAAQRPEKVRRIAAESARALDTLEPNGGHEAD